MEQISLELETSGRGPRFHSNTFSSNIFSAIVQVTLADGKDLVRIWWNNSPYGRIIIYENVPK